MAKLIESWRPAPDRIQTLSKAICARRGAIDYMTVAKAMVLGKASLAPKQGRTLASHLGIKKQTWHLWFTENLEEWVLYWEQRMKSFDDKPPPPSFRRRVITERDWRWMAQILRNTPRRSWEHRQRTIAARAAADPEYGHLRDISHVTLWRHSNLLTELGRHRATAPVAEVPKPNADGPELGL